MSERGETETRADVARRLDRPDEYGPVAYEIGSEDDPDASDEEAWLEEDPGD
jgi:GTP-binding protein